MREKQKGGDGDMTNKQKAAFLRREGWLTKSLGGKPIKMIDPVIGDGYYMDNLDRPVRIASRRKAQREARALRKAGYWYEPRTPEKPWAKEVQPGYVGWFTKAEALQLLSKKAGILK